ncbi:hypothetical protein [Streptomyces erythrochromogenes]|uniref:hypothetical protein n=1 Tax=Streptomyces erythrochromogenes TaxID=285574 RepID=UPI00386AADA0|nr:hypothetical protein OG364_29580 [Streptomyces erythrochromogenes]
MTTNLDPAHLYRHAPDLLAEAAELLTISSGLLTGTLAGAPADEEAQRAFRLRWAVQSDRRHLAHPDPHTAGQADEAAHALADLDRAHPWLVPAGLTVPAPGDDPGVRAYVRACYAAQHWA